MKHINKIFIGLAAFSLLLSSCTEEQLNTAPAGSDVTTDQIDDVLAVTPEKLSAGVQGIYAWMIEYNTLGLSSPQHSDFGYPAFVLSSELWGQDMVMTGNDYGWFWGDQEYTNRSYTSSDNYYIWNFFYKVVKKANDVIGDVPADTENPLFLAYVGQAKAMRAFAYLNLVQIYQHTYKGHETAPAVPITTEKTTIADAANSPRASVEKVYAFILEDLEAAILNLDGFERSSKVEVDLQVAYGLLARTYLNMEKWTEAAEAATNALGGVYQPMTDKQYNDQTTGFNDINNAAWMWGCNVEEVNDAVTSGIINYPSHFGSLNYGYVTAGSMFKAISADLYTKMGANDIRLEAFNTDEWWIIVPEVLEVAPYSNIKFKPYKGVLFQETNANDWPLMRAEEMILIQAEALAMGGNPGLGKTTLENFIQTYRDAAYTCPASDAAGVQEAVWMQRRIELWGEGFSWYDLKRLKKPIIRKYTGSNMLPDAQYNLPAEHGLFLQRIPLKELQSNHAITEADNNPIAVP